MFNQMVANSRKEARERKDMRLEDKYTDETDPVESQEQRIKRLHKKWEEENPDLLVNEVDEICKRKLEQEKEGERRAQKAQGGASAAADTDGAEDTADDDGAGDNDVDEKDDNDGEKKKEDNRKLVYESIWDDGPSPWQRQPPKQELPTTPQLNETPDNFKPWVGPQASADMSEEEITRRAAERKKAQEKREKETGVYVPFREQQREQQRAQELHDEEQKALEEIAGEGFKPNWYSRYREQTDEIKRKLNTSVNEAKQGNDEEADSGAPAKSNAKFAPPPRGKAVAPAPAPPPAGANELDEMD